MKIDYRIDQPAEVVFDYLTDMQKFVTVHPIIYRIDDLGENKYLVFEKLNFGFIPYSFTYYASVRADHDNSIVTITATVMKIVKIEMIYTIRSEGNKTLLNEVINFSSVLPVKPVMKKIFREQHEQLFKNIENVNK